MGLSADQFKILPFELTSEMIDAGVEALCEFQDDDGSTLSERVVEVFLHMMSRRPKEYGLTG